MVRRSAVAVAVLVVALAVAVARPAAAQTAQPVAEVNLSRIFAGIPAAFERVAARGYTELFRLLETLEVFRFEAEIDRFVGKPRDLNDTTSYKLSLLPFYIAYPIYPPLTAQMTRLDTVRANRIYTVTPSSVNLVDLRLTPVLFLDQFYGLGRGDEVALSLVTNLSAREISDLGVFLLSQYPFFPQNDEDWARTKRRVARAAVPIALAALVTGAAYDAGSLAYSGPIVKRGKDFELRYYGQFRSLGIHWHPYLRGGLTGRAFGFEAAAGLADQVNPTNTQPDQAVELALREGWLNQLVQPLGLDAFFEAAVKRSIGEPRGFVGDLTTARTGFFFKRDQAPLLPALAMRGSIEAESNLDRRLHLVGALGFEKPNSGITTVLQASLIPAPAGSGLPDNAQLNLFFVGSMEPLSQAFADDMSSLASQVREEFAGLEAAGEAARGLGAGAARARDGEPHAAGAAHDAGGDGTDPRRARGPHGAPCRRPGRLPGEPPARLRDPQPAPQPGRCCTDRWTRPRCSRPRNRVLARLQSLSVELARALGPLTALTERIAIAAARGRGAGGQRAGRRALWRRAARA